MNFAPHKHCHQPPSSAAAPSCGSHRTRAASPRQQGGFEVPPRLLPPSALHPAARGLGSRCKRLHRTLSSHPWHAETSEHRCLGTQHPKNINPYCYCFIANVFFFVRKTKNPISQLSTLPFPSSKMKPNTLHTSQAHQEIAAGKGWNIFFFFFGTLLLPPYLLLGSFHN